MTTPVRVRFAPSPTGHLHIGGARTAIYNWAFARHNGGTFILRIDDTDPERSTPENTQAILRAMRWLGLDWDEGPDVGGSVGPYFQTLRTDTYSAALEALRDEGLAYPCFCSPEALEKRRESTRTESGYSGYDRTCRGVSSEESAARISAGEPHAWRLAVPEDRGDVIFTDAIRGDMSFASAVLDDFVIVRSDGTPTYNYASVVDDALMGITHVIRGDDHLSNTPRQILVFEALGHAVPVFAHLSMIYGADGKRLSKRHGATSVEAYRDAGYLPETLLNYLALLGWSMDGETTVFSASQLAEAFTLDRVSRNPAIFDPEKLEWLNGMHIREMTPAALAGHLASRLSDAGLLNSQEAAARRDWLEALAVAVSERLKTLDDIVPLVRFLFVDEIRLSEEIRAKALSDPVVPAALATVRDALAAVEPFEHDPIEAALRTAAEALGAKPKVVFQAVRAAVTGSSVSLPLFESLALLGRERSLARLEAARALTPPNGLG